MFAACVGSITYYEWDRRDPDLGSGTAYKWDQKGTDLILYNSVIRTETTHSRAQCADMCVREPRCFGFDFTAGDDTCVLHDAGAMTPDAQCGEECQIGNTQNFGESTYEYLHYYNTKLTNTTLVTISDNTF